MSNLQNEAALKIFSERNSKLSSRNGEPMIDLHGLHPLEACDLLSDSINNLTTKRYKGRVLIITGTGHHSRGRSKVFPAIQSYLQHNGWRPKEGTLEDGMGGLLIITI